MLTVAGRNFRFARGFEGAVNGGALVVHEQDFIGLPENPSNRFHALSQSLGDSQRKIIILVKAKHFSRDVRTHVENEASLLTNSD